MIKFSTLTPNPTNSFSILLAFIWAAIIIYFSYYTLNKNLMSFFTVPEEKVNIVFMVSDGFGPASETFARTFKQHIDFGSPRHSDIPPLNDLPPLPLDALLVGSSRSRSSSSWITDSAAGATAFSCGVKSYNGAIAVNSTQSPCATVLEAAKLEGYLTGIVVTASITDATPASFSSHVTYRWYEDLIAEHQIGFNPLGRTLDLIFGGGQCRLLPSSDPKSCRKDNKNLTLSAFKNGFKKIISTKEQLQALNIASSLPMIGLFAPKHMPYEIDRTNTPSLREMTSKALEIMKENSKNSRKGFFMLVEGSRIDHAAHENDPATHAREILAYQDTISVVKEFVDANPGTVMISVSDHETGGLDLGVQLSKDYPDYLWYPEAIKNVLNSTSKIAEYLLRVEKESIKKTVTELIFPKWLGFDSFTEEEVELISNPGTSYTEMVSNLGSLISKRAKIGWSTHGHTGVDVNLYAYAGTTRPHVINPLRGNIENIQIGKFIQNYLRLKPETSDKIFKKIKHAIDNGSFRIFPDGSAPLAKDQSEGEAYHMF